jgi:hypothetical protein
VIHSDNPRLDYAKTVTQFLDHNSLHRALRSLDSPDLSTQTSGFS